MTLINRTLTAAFDIAFWPLHLLPPLAGLALVSLVTAVVLLFVVKATSDQRRIEAAKNGMYAAVLEMRLFNDDLPAILRAQVEMLKSNASYLRGSLAPVLWMVVPFSLLIGQLECYYGYAGLTPGRPVLVEAQIRDGIATGGAGPVARLTTPAEVRVETPAVWFPAARSVVWQVTPQSPGEFDLRIRVGSEELTKALQVSDDVARRSPARVGTGLFDQLRYPSEAPLPADGPVREITVAYPTRDIFVFGWRFPWLPLYGILSILFAVALRRPFGVSF
jgi:hypothetical protein